MHYTPTNNGLATYEEATHKPRVSIFIDGDDRYFQCTDGGLTMYGRTHKEAFNNLKALR